MVNKKHYREYINRDKFNRALSDAGLSITKLASMLYVSTNTIQYRLNHGWKKFDAEIVAKFLKIRLSDLI
jgi:lambda repressor-like predicted transcriptional regulator